MKRTISFLTALFLCLSITHACAGTFTGEKYSVSSGYSVSILWPQDSGRPSDTLLSDIQHLFFTAYPAMRETYGTTDVKDVQILLCDESGMPSGVPAYTSGATIYCSIQFFEADRRNLNCIVHELFHVVQNGYPMAEGDHLTAVMCEGMADVARYEYRVFDDPAWSLKPYAEGRSYTDSYTVTAGFLVWISETIDADFCLRFNRLLHEGVDAGSAFMRLTGYDADELWAMYAKSVQ